MAEFISRYPSDLESNWSGDCQGLTHNETHWFISTAREARRLAADKPARIWKVKLGRDLNKDFEPAGSTEVPTHFKDLGYDHYGDIDYFEGKIFAPLERSGDSPQDTYMLVFDAADLRFIGAAPLSQQAGQDENRHASWCAVNHADGKVYTSLSDSNELIIYRFSVQAGGVELAFDRFRPLFDENGIQLLIHKIQGGVFSAKNNLLYLSNNSETNPGITVFDTLTWRRTQHIEVDFDQGGAAQEEIEGLTIWDIGHSEDPTIHGQIHLVILNNNLIADDQVSIVHLAERGERRDSPVTPVLASCAALSRQRTTLTRLRDAAEDVNQRKALNARIGTIIAQMLLRGCPIDADET